MKTIKIAVLASAFMALVGCSSSKQPSEIKVLYLGGKSEWVNAEFGSEKKFPTEEEYQNNIQQRMDAFGEMLRQYFDSVTVMRAEDWEPEMSSCYDVTIFDGIPRMLEDAKRNDEPDEYGNPVYLAARYLPDDFSSPAITIGSVGEIIGRRIGSKNDWYCRCLDANAHSMNLEHPIFKGPFHTDITLHKEPTPENAFHYQYFFDEPLPDSVMMWTVNTAGYKTDSLLNPGMVSRPWGYADSPESEVISSGVCDKTIDAVAIGRHGNMLTWGFLCGPEMMTDEAKTVFANAVVYMADKGGTTITRKYQDRRAPREYVKELDYLCKRSSYEDRCVSDSLWYAENNEPYQRPTYSAWLKRYAKNLYDEFGDDEDKYHQFFTEDAPYIYGLPTFYMIELDKDAKAWQIRIGDLALIEKAISCLEKGEDVDRAKRILERYTLCEFDSPKEWRNWIDTYHDKIFFTQSGGWLYMVNEKGAPGNDYKVIERRKEAKKKAESANSQDELNATNPVGVSLEAKKQSGNIWEVKIAMQILPGYHIYDVVDPTDAYVPLKIAFNLPNGCELVGDIKKPHAKPFGSSATTVFEDEEIAFVQKVKASEGIKGLTCEVSYQCCDAHVCLPPVKKECKLK